MGNEHQRKRRETVLMKGIVLNATWSPDNRQMLAVYADNTLRMFDVATGQLQETIVGIEGILGPVMRVSPDGHYRVTQQERMWQELVYVVQTAAGQQTLTPSEFSAKYGWKNDPSRVPTHLDPQPESSSPEPAGPATDASAVPSPPLETGDPISPMALVMQPAKLTGVKSWSIETVAPRCQTAVGRILAISPDSRLVASANLDGVIRIYELPNCQLLHAWFGHHKGVVGVSWSADGHFLASVGRDDRTCIWEYPSGRLAGQVDSPDACCVDWSPSSSQLAIGGALAESLGCPKRASIRRGSRIQLSRLVA